MSADQVEMTSGEKNVDEEKIPYPKEAYAWYVVMILMIVYIFSFMDRQILGLLVGPIKADLDISDTQMSLLMGFTFALFYTIFGIPIGRLADSKNRVGIIAIGLAVWSLFTTACGMTSRFFTLALARMGVGVGEAALSPSAYSLITDYFRPHRQALAISIYGAGIYIGSGLAYVLGGYVVGFTAGAETVDLPVVGAVKPWQSVFFMIGVPGLIFTLALLTVKEPVRRGLKKTGNAAKAVSVPIREVMGYIKDNWCTFFFHNVGFALCSFISYGSTQWIPTFLNRTYEYPIRDAGIFYGYIVMFFGTAGIIFGGWLADRYTQRGYKDARMRSALTAALLHIPFGILFPLMPNAQMALVLLCGAVFFAAMPFGVGPAAIQEMMPNRMRAQASAVYLFVLNLIGLGFGPSAVALSTDYLFGSESQLYLSLVLVSTVFGVVASILLYLGMRHFRASMEHLEKWKNT
ncbi:spinster family MFS transporter [Gilvimarinus sp. F26214L]|uniref:spinster family MFS transporter n=1 Tax=Gilvimarinus sp. DZF01 TaxID=3461371 RepID=UPI0040461472